MGRGKYYHHWRRLGEEIEHRFYRGGWAAWIAKGMGLQGQLHVDRRSFSMGGQASGPVLKVAFASDLHAGPLTHPGIFDLLADTISRFAPDVMLLGGDYVSHDHRYVDLLARRIRRIRPRFGIFGVFGNHDLWLDDCHIQSVLESAGVRFLVNGSQRLPAPFSHVSICGLDEPGTGMPDAKEMFTDAARRRLVVMHSPLGLKHLRGHNFDVAFCGHTHGGQIALPDGRPIILPKGAGDRRFAHGHFHLETGGELLVSRGVGMSGAPVRLFAPSEVHLCTVTTSA
jgi:predicted MPP superfamily phosphohydrolase